MDVRVSQVVFAVERLAGAVAANMVYKESPRDPDDSCAGCYPPNDDAEIERLRSELAVALEAVLP